MSIEICLQEEVKTRVPLVVDLDGSLVRSDLLFESAFAFLGADPSRIFTLIALLFRGRALLKFGIAFETTIDAAHLPYEPGVMALVEKARRDGRKIYVASASNERYVAAVAAHIGADGWFGSSANENLSDHAKASRLVEAFGNGAFDYIGDSKADLPVWEVCRRGFAIHPSKAVRRRLDAAGNVEIIEPTRGTARAWIKLMRVHQWAKNALVFVPVLTAHKFGAASLIEAIGAFFAFSLAASSVYILNDLIDIQADRAHPSKRRRPLAAGTVPISSAIPGALLLMAAAFISALFVGPYFAAMLLVYAVLTTAYTFVLKRKMLIDVFVLAALYTIRVIAGAVAISVDVSEWLLAFSMFIFTSLALIKRYVEMTARLDGSLPDPSNRNYRKTDLDILAALAAASAFNAVTVFALYVSSDAVGRLYRHPKALWLVCPILMYWLARVLMMAHRRMMDDDPIVFALKDRNSLLALALIGAIMIGAAY